MSDILSTTFRSKESTCCLAWSNSSNTSNQLWISGDSLGTVYQSSSGENGGMTELISLEEASILALAVSPAGDECVVGKENEVDICSFPHIEVTNSMIVRSSQPITHMEYDNDGGHM